MILKWALREIRNQYKFSLFFILNFSIGLIGFLCLDAFKTSLDQTFQANAKSLLSADLEVSVRRMLTEVELAKAQEAAGPGAQMGRTWELFSMVAAGPNSRLVQLKSVDPSYPLYGNLKIETPAGIVDANSAQLNSEPIVWLYPELITQLDVKVGDKLVLGGRDFTIAGTVAEDGSQGFRMAAMASKIYVGIEQIRQTQLIGFGTTLNDSLLFKVPPNINSTMIVESIKKQIEDPAVRVQNYQAAAEDSGRTLKYLSDYLGLVSLVALFLAGLGSAYLFRSFIYSRFYQIAILNSLGLSKRKAQLIYLTQLFILGVGASLISLLGALLALPILSEVLKSLSPIAMAISLPLKTVGLAMMMGIFGSLLVGAPFLRPTNRLQTSSLLMEGSEIQAPTKWHDFLLFLPGLLLYWGLSIWQAKSFKLGSQFVLLFLGSLAALWILGWLLLRLFGWLKVQSPWPLRQALLSLSRRKLSSLAIVVSLGLGTLLMNILPQLKVSLQQDLTAPEKVKLPSLFLFDIQDEQLDPLKTFLSERNLTLQQTSALVRARILKVNGVDFERANDSSQFQTREDESRMRFRNRGVNLTYRERLTESETLKAGRDFSGTFDPASGKLAEISVEQRFADQMEFKLHDRLVFDIQGIEIEAEIVNFRSVKWNSFQPNFFIQVQPGVLEEAPKTFLASISALPKADVQPLQTELVRQFPNVSMIDVARVIEKVLEVSNQMSWSLELMAGLSLFAGFVVLFSIANYEVRRRSWDLNLLKIFGASHKQLFRYLMFEFGLLSFLSSCFGVLVSLVISYALSYILFEGTYLFNITWPILSLVFVTTSSILILYVVSRRVIREKPSEILQQK